MFKRCQGHKMSITMQNCSLFIHANYTILYLQNNYLQYINVINIYYRELRFNLQK